MTATVLISTTALVVAGIALIGILFQRRTLRTLAQQVQNLEGQLQEDKLTAPVTSRFSAHLSDAEKEQQKNEQELKEKLHANSPVKPQGQADRYRYAVALAAQGQGVDTIAQALNMAPTEVEQVIQLARVKRPV